MKRKTYTIFSILDLPERNRGVKKSIEDLLTCAPQKFLDFKGVPSTTMSFTDMYMFGVLLSHKAVRVVVKLYMSHESAVRYEAQAYEDLFNLYENGYTRNVAILIGHTLGFTGNDIVDMLAKNTLHARKKFNINLMYMFCRIKKERPSITALPDDTAQLDKLSAKIYKRLRLKGCTQLTEFDAKCQFAQLASDDYDSPGTGPGSRTGFECIREEDFVGVFEYGYIVTVQMQGQKFADTFSQLREGAYDPTEFRRLVFQIVYTLYVMRDTGIVHGDLHFNNIFVDHLHDGESPVAHYRFFETTFAITSDFVPRIFDMDRSNIKNLGVNPFYENRRARRAHVHVTTAAAVNATPAPPKKSYKLDDMYFFIDNLVKTYKADYLVRARDMITYTENLMLSGTEQKARQAAVALIGEPFLQTAPFVSGSADVFVYPR
jgi:hypothetical protein